MCRVVREWNSRARPLHTKQQVDVESVEKDQYLLGQLRMHGEFFSLQTAIVPLHVGVSDDSEEQ